MEQLASACDVSVDTVRYYQSRGLLPPPSREGRVAWYGASHADRILQLGRQTTGGLGAGAQADLGCAAAEESLAEIDEMLDGLHMCFVAAGMGGGTGTGAAPIIARAARAKGILTVGVVTKPFAFEGKRQRIAQPTLTSIDPGEPSRDSRRPARPRPRLRASSAG